MTSRIAAAAALIALTLTAACSSSGSPSPGNTATAPANPSRSSSTAPSSASAPTATPTATPTSAAERHDPASSGSGYVPSLKHAPDDQPSWYPSGCQQTQNATTTHMCTFNGIAHPALTVAMVGDSTTAQWIAAVVAIAKVRHWKVVTDFHSRCPWTTAMTVNLGQTVPYTACQTWGRKVLHDVLDTIKPQVVLTTARPVLGTVDYPPGPAAFAQIGHGMATYWRALLAHHIAVVPIRESPEMGIDIPTCLATHPRRDCNVSASRAITPNPPTVVAAGVVPGAHLVSMNDIICPHSVCTATYGRIVKFRDQHHLTATYVEFVTAQFRDRLLATRAFG